MPGAPSNPIAGPEAKLQRTAVAPLTVSATKGQGGPCPDTHQGKYDCNTISAIANVRQADAAEWFNHLAYAEIGVGLATATVAVLAARWAKKAADAGTNSYRAFVAAEDASIDVVFKDGVLIRETAEGKRSSHFGFSVSLTNIGRSAAKIHRCTIGRQRSVIVDDLLEVGSQNTVANRFVVEASEFKFEVHYSSALHPNAVLSLVVQPYLVEDNKMSARIASRHLSERRPV